MAASLINFECFGSVSHIIWIKHLRWVIYHFLYYFICISIFCSFFFFFLSFVFFFHCVFNAILSVFICSSLLTFMLLSIQNQIIIPAVVAWIVSASVSSGKLRVSDQWIEYQCRQRCLLGWILMKCWPRLCLVNRYSELIMVDHRSGWHPGL